VASIMELLRPAVQHCTAMYCSQFEHRFQWQPADVLAMTLYQGSLAKLVSVERDGISLLVIAGPYK